MGRIDIVFLLGLFAVFLNACGGTKSSFSIVEFERTFAVELRLIEEYVDTIEKLSEAEQLILYKQTVARLGADRRILSAQVSLASGYTIRFIAPRYKKTRRFLFGENASGDPKLKIHTAYVDNKAWIDVLVYERVVKNGWKITFVVK